MTFSRLRAGCAGVCLLTFLNGAIASPRLVVTGPADAAAVVEAKLAGDGGFTVLGRAELGEIFKEWAQGDASRLGRLAGADFMVSVTVDGRRLSVVDATTGRWLGEGSAEEPAAVVRKLLDKPLPAAGRSVAVVGEGGLDGLRRWLTGEGFQVLDRERSLEVLGERELADTGFTEPGARTAPFLGAAFVIHREGLLLRVFAGDGRLLGMVPVRGDGPDGAGEERLRGMLRGGEEPDAVFRQHVAAEALQPFYRGIREFAAGRYPEAAAEFQRAYEASNRFEPAYRWEARCYDAMGLPRLAAAVTRFADLGFVGRGAALGNDLTPRDGTLFLGIEGNDALASRLSLEAIPAFPQRTLFLPESLAVAREQFDLLARTGRTTGKRWETAGGFVVREAIAGRLQGDGKVRLEFWDTLTGELLSSHVTPRPRNDAEWTTAFEHLMSPEGPQVLDKGAFRPMSKDGALAAWKSARSNPARNAALLHLLLTAPEDAVTIGAGFLKGSDEKDGLDNFLNHAKREHLIAVLPSEHPMRPWLELERLQAFSPWPGNGRHLSGEPVEALPELDTFSRSQPPHPARAVARYFWLFDTQAQLTPDQLVRETEDLLAMLAADNAIPRREGLLKVTRSWVHIARVAAGKETSARRPADFHVPERFRIEIARDGTPKVEWNDVTGGNRWGLSLFDEEEWKTECGFTIACVGRGDRLLRIPPQWMDRFPRCLGLAGAIAWGGMKAVSSDLGRPWIHTLAEDPGAETRHWRRMAEYARDTLLLFLGRVQTSEEFAGVEARVNYFIHRLNSRAFREVVPDDEYRRWHEELRAASRDAAQRAGCADRTTIFWDTNMHDWRTLTREVSAKRLANDLDTGPDHFKDIQSLLENERAAFARAVRPDSRASDLRSWWQATDGEITFWLSARELADLVLSRLPSLRGRLGGPELFDDDRALLLDVGIILMHGGRNAEAEEIFRVVAEAPPTPSSDESITRALRASSLWHLARVLRVDGRKVEAVSALHRCLEEAEGLHVRYLWRAQPNYRDWLLRVPQGASVGSLALRTLEEMRFDPDKARWPDGIGAVTVRTRQLNNPELVVFFRRPQSESRGGLVLVPSVNESVLPMLAGDSPWSRLADEQGLVLIAPQFNATDTHRIAGHASTAHQNAQDWSGGALLAAVAEIEKRVPFDSRRLLLHGFGGGAQFVQSFSRWKPERVAALSAHSAATWSWLEGIPGQRPLADLRGVPMLFTAGELDDYGLGESNRRASTAQLVTALRAAGCEARFELLSGAPHVPTSEMEALARDFLRHQP